MAVNIDQGVAAAQQLLGTSGLPGYETQLLQAEVGASRVREQDQQAGNYSPPWLAWSGQFIDYGAEEWNTLLSAASTFASNTDYRYYPTLQQLQGAAAQGVTLNDPKSFEQYMNQYMPDKAKQDMPWLGSGMGKTGFDNTINGFKATWEQLTGDTSHETDPQWLSHVQSLIQQGVSSSQYQQQLTTDPNMWKQYGWLKYGKDYNAFVQYKNDPNTRQLAVSRFGADGANTDQSYLNLLSSPTQSLQSATSPIATQASAREQQNVVGRSAVR